MRRVLATVQRRSDASMEDMFVKGFGPFRVAAGGGVHRFGTAGLRW